MTNGHFPRQRVATLSLVSRFNYRRFLVPLVITSLMLLCVQSAAGQTKPSDAEMKEILRLLLEQEVQRSAGGGNISVLLGPNVKSSWIPEAPGFAIRKLSYDEQRQVSEYYDFTPSFKDNVIEVTLAKGNYCRKVGRRYEFRRQEGAWQSKIVGEMQSTAVGGRCDGCAIGSGASYSVAKTPAPAGPGTNNLRLTGSVRKISCARDAQYVRCKAELNLKFTNVASTSLIMLQPHGEYEFWHGGTSLALSEKDSNTNSFVYNSSAWPSFYRSPLYQTLANLLDQSHPPKEVTRVLAPGASWSWDTSITLGLQEGNSCNQHVGVEIGWNEVKRRTTPLWLRVYYELWPFNVENFKRDLGGILKKRWQSHGVLYLEEKSGEYWQATLTSEPIEFPLYQVDLVQ